MLRFLLLIVVAAGLSRPAGAAAQDEPAAESDDGPVVSLTLSPLHLLGPVLELTAEVRVGDYCGIALLGGFGSVTVDLAGNTDEEVTVGLWNVGAQVVAYPLEPFESLQLGLEVQYAHASIDGDLNGQRVSAIGSGLAVGPLVGYKLIVDVGFTFFVQGGVAFIAIEADAEDDSGQTASADEKRVIPLLNLNVGWSL